MKHHLLAVAGYVICTFAVQATSHFAINADHYAALPYMRAEPLIPLGILSMVIQGAVLSFLYARSDLRGEGVMGALIAAWGIGAVIVSYIVLAEFGKYDIPDFASWAAVELSAGAVQFSLIGIALWLTFGGRLRRTA